MNLVLSPSHEKKIKFKRKIVYLREVEIVGIYGYM